MESQRVNKKNNQTQHERLLRPQKIIKRGPHMLVPEAFGLPLDYKQGFVCNKTYGGINAG